MSRVTTRICCICVIVIATSAFGLNAQNGGKKDSPEIPIYNTVGYEDPNTYWFRPARNFLSVMANNDEFAVYFAEFLNGRGTFWDVLDKSNSKAAIIGLPIFGLTLALATMVVGIVYCSCGCCCGNCGSKRVQSGKSSKNKCRRITLMIFLGLFLAIVLVGVIYTFAANPVVDKPVATARNSLLYGIQDVYTYAKYTTEEFTIFWDTDASVMLNSLENDANGLKTNLEEAVASGYGGALQTAQILSNELEDIIQDMVSYTSSLNSLKTALSDSQTDVGDFQTEIDGINAQIEAQCSGVEYLKIKNNVTSDVIDAAGTSIDKTLGEVEDTTQKYDLSKMQVYINERVDNDNTYNIIGLNATFEALMIGISTYSDATENAFTSIEDVLNTMLSQALEANETIHANMIVYNNFDDIIVYTRLPVSLVMLVIFLLFVIGFTGGALLFRSNTLPTERSKASNCFGRFLLQSVIWSLVFSALFWIAIAGLFIPGCMAELFCRPLFSDSSNFTTLDHVITASGIDFGDIFGANSNVNLSNILLSCAANMAAYEALRLEGQVHLEAILNNQTMNEQFANNFKALEVSENYLNILPEDLQDALHAYSSASEVDFKDLDTALKNPVVPASYEEWSDILIGNCQCEGDTCDELSTTVQDFYTNNVDNFKDEVVDVLSVSTAAVEADSTDLINLIDDSIGNSIAVSRKDANAFNMYNEALSKSSQEFMASFSQFQTTTLFKVTRELGQCLPLWKVYHYSRMKLCRGTVEEYNGYWFNLGVCLFFLIGSCVTAVMLSKYFLKMKKLDPNYHYSEPYSKNGSDSVSIVEGWCGTSRMSEMYYNNNNGKSVIAPTRSAPTKPLDETPVKIPRIGTRNPPISNSESTKAITWRMKPASPHNDSFRKPLSTYSNNEDYY